MTTFNRHHLSVKGNFPHCQMLSTICREPQCPCGVRFFLTHLLMRLTYPSEYAPVMLATFDALILCTSPVPRIQRNRCIDWAETHNKAEHKQGRNRTLQVEGAKGWALGCQLVHHTPNRPAAKTSSKPSPVKIC